MASFGFGLSQQMNVQSEPVGENQVKDQRSEIPNPRGLTRPFASAGGKLNFNCCVMGVMVG